MHTQLFRTIQVKLEKNCKTVHPIITVCHFDIPINFSVRKMVRFAIDIQF